MQMISSAPKLASRPSSAPAPSNTRGSRPASGRSTGRSGAPRREVDLTASQGCSIVLRDRLNAALGTQPRFRPRGAETPSEVPSRAVSLAQQGSSARVVQAQTAATLGERLAACARYDESSFLAGLSSPATQANHRGAQSQRLLLAGRCGGHGDGNAPMRKEFTCSINEGFSEETDGLVRSMEDLRNRHQAFEGPLLDRTFGGNAERRKELTALKRERERELAERRVERFEAYKMCRKFEPELPPLTQVPLSEPPPKPKQHIMLRNASSKTLQAHTPTMRKAAQRHRQVAHKRQCKANFEYCIALQEKLLVARQNSLEEKERRRESVLASRRISASMPSFRSLEDTLKVEESQPLNVDTDESPMAISSDVKIDFLGDILQDEATVRALRMCVVMFRKNKCVEKRRKAARTMNECLQVWQQKGSFLLKLLKFKRNICFIQSWWRACRWRLHALRDALAYRWVQLEGALVAKEMSAGDNVAPSMPTMSRTNSTKRFNGASPVARPPEDRPGFLSETVRLRFLEAELRARRYFILPPVALWQQEVAKWKAMNCTEDSFQYAPRRPSYLPPAHLHDAETECPLDCPGRRGDRELLAMVQTARRNPHGGGWQTVPKAKPPKVGTAIPRAIVRKISAEPEPVVAKPKEEPTDIFWDVPDDELRSWGVDPELLPAIGGPQSAGLATPGEDPW